MKKTILITGSTDGIGLETAKHFQANGHKVWLHGRSAAKLDAAKAALLKLGGHQPETFVADLSSLAQIDKFAEELALKADSLDVLINNAGVYRIPGSAKSEDHLDLRFAVNTIAPYRLTQRLLPNFSSKNRIINLSSAAQSPVNLDALAGKIDLSDGAAYAQSKLALTMWSSELGRTLQGSPVIVSVNPGSFLGSKMVKEAYGVAGKDMQIGVKILSKAALSEQFSSAAGQYFDNDSGQFAAPHRDALDSAKCKALIECIEAILTTSKP